MNARIHISDELQLPDWTDRQVKPGKRGSVSKTARPILKRLNLSPGLWLLVVEQFRKRRLQAGTEKQFYRG